MNNLLLGAIVGDIFGQPYEFKKSRQNSPCFDLFENKGKFTDDTVCTIGVAEAIIHNPKNPDFTTFVSKWCSKYPYAGYGKLFKKWIVSDKKEPYGSYGNGSAISGSIAYAYWKEMNEDMKDYALEILPKEMIKVINDFDNFIKQQ